MNKRKKLIPDVVRGGVAIPLGRNYYYMSGRKHEKGGIDIGKNPRTGIEVEDGEVMHLTKDNVKVFSSLPFLNGKSPAERVMGGESPTKVFNAQELYKDKNGINDDGTKKKAEWGMEEGSTADVVTDMLPFVGSAKEITRLVRNPSWKQLGWTGLSILGDVAGFGAGKLITGAIKASRAAKLSKARNVYRNTIDAIGNSPHAKQIARGKADKVLHPTIKTRGVKRRVVCRKKTNDDYKVDEILARSVPHVGETIYDGYVTGMSQKHKFGGKHPDELKYGGNKGIYSITTNGGTRLRKLPFTGDRPKAVLGTTRSVGAYKKYYDEYSKSNFAYRSALNTFAGVYDADDYALYKVNGARDWKKVKRIRDRKIELERRKIESERRKNNANLKTNNKSNTTSVNATNNKSNINAKIENKTNNKVENNIDAANTKENKVLSYEEFVEGYQKSKENKESNTDINKVDNSKNSVSTNSSKEDNNKTVSAKTNPTPTKAVSSTSTSSSNNSYKPKVANTNSTKVAKTNINKGVTWENVTPEQLKKMTPKQKEKIYKQIPKEGTSISSNKSFNVPRITAHLPEMEHEIVDIPKTKFNYTTGKYEDNPEYSTFNRWKVKSKVKDKDYFKNGLGDLDEALKNNIEREKQRRASNKSDWKKYWENNKENIVLDGASLASNIVGSIGSFFANKHAINKAVAPVAPSAPIAKRAAKLKTKVNINPQLAQLAKTASDYERTVDNNTASSQVALSRKQPARNNVLTQAINLYGNKENKETELINRDRLNQQSVANSNVDAYNSYLDKKIQYENAKIAFENNRIAKRADNIVGLVNNLNAGVQDIVGKNLQRRNEKNTISAMMFANPNLPAEMVHSLGLINDETLKAYRKAYKLKDNKQG